MRKLLLSILALVLLASTATAAPDSWRRLNGMWQNIPVSEQADAIERGGSFYLYFGEEEAPIDPALALYPWQDGSADVLYMKPVGLEYDGPMVETPYGWKVPLKNHVYGATFLQLVDLQSARVPDALENYLGNGVALIYSGMPVANIPQGEWIPKRIAFSGIVDDCSFVIQDPAVLVDSTYPDWVPYSIPIYHDSKRNNGGFRKYTTGKIGHLPRPIAIGWSGGQITGWAYGEYRSVAGEPYQFDKVFFRDAQFDADMTRRGIGNPVTVAVSVDFGYNTVGGTTTSNPFLTTDVPTAAAEDGVVDAILVYTNSPSSGESFTAGIYSGAQADSNPLVTNSDIYMATATDPPISDVGAWKRIAYNAGGGASGGGASAKPEIVSGTKYNLLVAQQAVVNYYYDTGQTGWTSRRYNGVTPGAAPPDPIGTPASTLTDFGFSRYIEYTPATATPVTTLAAVTPTSTAKGSTSVDISCDIDTDSETITDAEWFFGADPGEGSGNAFDSLTGTATSKTAAADIDPSALDYAVNTISMRGFDAVSGWGAVDTADLNITLAAPTSVAATPADQQITVTWVEGADAGDQDLYWDTSSPVDVTSTRVAAVSSGEVVGSLTNGTTYYFAVLNNSYLGAPASGFSAEVSAVAGVPVDPAGGAGLTLDIGLGL